MAHVDALSRNPVDTEEISSENFVFRIEPEDWVLAGQLTDKKLQVLHKILQHSANDTYEESVHKNYKLVQNRLYRKLPNKELWVVPKAMRREIVRTCHDNFGHFAVDKTMKKLLESYWFPNMRRYVEKYIASCVRCLFYKTPRGKQEGMLHPIERSTVPFHTLHADHLGPFNRSSAGKKYIFAVIDAATKFIFLTATKDTKVAPVTRFISKLTETYGVPFRIVTDQGSCFTSKAFKAYCQNANIKHVLNALSTPRANGQIERFVVLVHKHKRRDRVGEETSTDTVRIEQRGKCYYGEDAQRDVDGI